MIRQATNWNAISTPLYAFAPILFRYIIVPWMNNKSMIHIASINFLFQIPQFRIHYPFRIVYLLQRGMFYKNLARLLSKRVELAGFTKKSSIPTAAALSLFSGIAFAVSAMMGILALIRFGRFRIFKVAS